MNRLMRCALVLVILSACGLWTGCARVLDPGPPPLRIMLMPELPRPEVAQRLVPPLQIVVALPETGRALDTDHIAVIQGREVSYLPNARWSSHLPQMLQRHIIDALDAGSRCGDVAAEGAGVFPDYRLVTDIQHFAARQDAEGRRIDMSLRLQLLDVRKGRVVSSTVAMATVPLANGERASILDGFEKALGEVLAITTRWTDDALRSTRNK